jgi:hypothetical protein
MLRSHLKGQVSILQFEISGILPRMGVMNALQVRVSPPKLGGVAAAKPQTGWFPNRSVSECILESFRLRVRNLKFFLRAATRLT